MHAFGSNELIHAYSASAASALLPAGGIGGSPALSASAMTAKPTAAASGR
jgi:hypothetical protein